ncbi:MAG: SDR family oxidoreductase [Promethearchaeota archaeon]|nr:MAG: SDR family oxidoreductase [Candidatus Lokiarchaeota archaeon]
MLLADKNIVITGSGRGIGKHVALLCAKEGANIGLTSRTLGELKKVRNEIEQINAGVEVSVHEADITNLEQVKTIFKKFHEDLGPLNAVVANAGWHDSQPSLTYDIEVFRKILDVHIMGVYYTFRASYPYLKLDDKNDKARFVLTGSMYYLSNSSSTTPFRLPYIIAEYGLVGLIKALAKEFRKKNITFNMVIPQTTDTPLTRGENAGDGNKPPHFLNPWDVSVYYLFLLSEYANRYNFKLLNTFDFEMVKKIISKTPEEKKNNIEDFLKYLMMKNEKVYQNVKHLSEFVEFLLDYPHAPFLMPSM